MNAMGRVRKIFPNWLALYSVVIYIAALAAVSFIYSAYSLPWYYLLSGVVAVVVFFIFGEYLTNSTTELKIRKSKSFEKRIFIVAFIPRVLFMLLLYRVFQTNYGNAFGFESGDAIFYDLQAQLFADAISSGDFLSRWQEINKTVDISDMGYGAYVGAIYALTGNSIIAVRILKCVLSSITVVIIYRLAKRNYTPQTARIAAIFCALWPNFWYYCGSHLKETEMVFLSVLFVEQVDQMLRSRRFTAWKIIPILLIGAAMFTFRTPLGLVAFLALLFSVVMSSSKVVSWGKRIVVGLLAVLLIGVTIGNRIEERAKTLVEDVQSGQQKESISWYATRKNGNNFANYASSAVFAPMIFTLPFPSMVRPFEGQDVQQLLNGGNFAKNIISIFTIMSLILLLLSGRWREHLMPLSFMLGYLAVLALSSFAHSERFHQPVMPFEFMFAAYGLSIAVTKPKYKRWFKYWCVLMFVVAIAWNWFKMAGRGLA